MLKWDVYIYDFNARKVATYDIFSHKNFFDDCQKAVKNFSDKKEDFLWLIKNTLRYYFWSKREWEILISDLSPHPDYPDLKVDVYSQVMMNWEAFSEYVWGHKEELKTAKKK